MSKSLKKSSHSYQHGNLREAILKVSLQVIEKKGEQALSMRDLAKMTGVTHQAPYRHFKDKDALLAALAQDGFEQLYALMVENLKSATDPMEKLERIIQNYMAWAFEHPDHFRLMFSRHIPEYETSESLQKVTNQTLELILKVVEENQEAKNLRPGDPRPLARHFWASIHGATLLLIDRQFKPLNKIANPVPQLAKDILWNLVNGLKPSL
jgi:AcrR family transcriptional regulator